jgi:hypothetical protein
LHCHGGRGGKSLTSSLLYYINPIIQAQFIISPDHDFSEKGAISKINYRERFRQYKKLIIKIIDAPRMKSLVARFNAQLFQVYSPDGQASLPPAEEQAVVDEEEEFCRAFQDDVVISELLPGTVFRNFSYNLSSATDSTPVLFTPVITPPPNPDALSVLPPNLGESPAAANAEGEPTDEPAVTTKKKKSSKKTDKPPAEANRRSTRNDGGAARKAGGKVTKA